MKHICLECEQGFMELKSTDVTISQGENTEILKNIYGWHCPHCREIEFTDDENANRFTEAVEKLTQDIAKEQALYLATVRKRLNLTQVEASKLVGEGVNAFSRYERAVTRPMKSVINLFKLLDKHPELLKEIRP